MTIYRNPAVDFAAIVNNQRYKAVHSWRYDYGARANIGRFYIAPWNALCIFTLDIGHHTSGWWKNPDYDACWHLSISYQDLESGDMAPQNHKLSWKIIRAFYESHYKLVWSEPPYTPNGKAADVWHYRLFVDRATLLPLFPRGEVYSRELTEAGWKSFSEVRAELQKQEEKEREVKGNA
jgi:hypothetical protein